MSVYSIPICFIVDENIYMHLLMICKSIIKHTTIPYHFCILTNRSENIDPIRGLLGSICDELNYTVRALTDNDVSLLSSIYVQESRVDITAFGNAQLLLPDYFSEFKKFIFLEPDQIVRRDLGPMWKEIVDNDIKLAAVPYMGGHLTLRTLFSLYPNTDFCAYNLGVVIVDTEFWKEMKCRDRCLEACKRQKEMNGGYYNFYAEGAMTVALQMHFKQLDNICNTFDLGHKTNISKEVLNKAIILHWNGPQKPWKENGLYKEYYILE
jgi:lipopolysaccharide biosynthesis glycosyltransferase